MNPFKKLHRLYDRWHAFYAPRHDRMVHWRHTFVERWHHRLSPANFFSRLGERLHGVRHAQATRLARLLPSSDSSSRLVKGIFLALHALTAPFRWIAAPFIKIRERFQARLDFLRGAAAQPRSALERQWGGTRLEARWLDPAILHIG